MKSGHAVLGSIPNFDNDSCNQLEPVLNWLCSLKVKVFVNMQHIAENDSCKWLCTLKVKVFVNMQPTADNDRFKWLCTLKVKVFVKCSLLLWQPKTAEAAELHTVKQYSSSRAAHC